MSEGGDLHVLLCYGERLRPRDAWHEGMGEGSLPLPCRDYTAAGLDLRRPPDGADEKKCFHSESKNTGNWC